MKTVAEQIAAKKAEKAKRKELAEKFKKRNEKRKKAP
jgi:hypothetical protein